MNLIIDIGNTAAKMAVFDGGNIVEVVYDSNQTLERLPEVCRAYTIEKAIAATVFFYKVILMGEQSPALFINARYTVPLECNLADTLQESAAELESLAIGISRNSLLPSDSPLATTNQLAHGFIGLVLIYILCCFRMPYGR